MAQTRLKEEQGITKRWVGVWADTAALDFSSLGALAQEINGGSGNMSVDVTLMETSDVLIEWCLQHDNSNNYGAHLLLYRGASNIFSITSQCLHSQAINNVMTKFSYLDENVAAGTYTYKIKAQASGSTSNTTTFNYRSLSVRLVEKQ